MRQTVLCAVALLCMLTGAAQPRTDYYPNGKKCFEGQYTLTLPATFGEARDIAGISRPGERVSWAWETRELLPGYLLPNRRYEGHCLFYNLQGQPVLEGNFSAGMRQGLFIFYTPGGSEERRQEYHNDMPTGRWEVTDRTGRLVSVSSYRAYTEEMLDSLYRYSLFRNKETAEPPYGTARRYNVTKQINKRYNTLFLYNYLSAIDAAIRSLAVNTMWDGDFIVSPNIKDYQVSRVAMHFIQNLPDGNWEVTDSKGRVACTLQFANGTFIGGSSFGKTVQQLSDSAFAMPEPVIEAAPPSRRN